ncbi:MAG: DUF3368 domain-containing protein [Chitinophagales bacterium]
MKVVVSDTSTVSNLIVIEELHLLKDIYGGVIIPPAVHSEILALRALGKNIESFTNASWIELVNPDKNWITEIERFNLDKGETQAIALCKTINADLLLIDEKLGRALAKDLGISTTGLLGTLVKAKNAGKIKSVKVIMDSLKDKAGFWITDSLYTEVLKLCKEL